MTPFEREGQGYVVATSGFPRCQQIELGQLLTKTEQMPVLLAFVEGDQLGEPEHRRWGNPNHCRGRRSADVSGCWPAAPSDGAFFDDNGTIFRCSLNPIAFFTRCRAI